MKNKTVRFRASEPQLLYLTNIRSSQQDSKKANEIIKEIKLKMRGLPFKIRFEPPLYCKRNSMAMIEFRNRNIYQVTLSKVTCKSWTCPKCSKVKALKARYLIRSIAVANNLDYFLTLTLDPSKIPLKYKSEKNNNTHSYITKLFNALLSNLRRRIKSEDEKLKYIWVVEFQKNGNAHLHILLNKFLDVKEIRKIWVRLGGGRIMKAETAKSIEGLSFYLSNYIVKGLKNDSSKKSHFKYFEKRYAISQSCIRINNHSNRLFNKLSKDDRKRAIKELRLDWVYNALDREEFEDKLLLFEQEKKQNL